ncbi:hydroxycarboxylic acid receptor 3 [Brachyistius frenatus]|uniref:hydroxycarboxylic acid receptor 3 n=1 Tax=Brachyistius frenatus TaxID=100188 RepID=UPI0037E7CBAF
MDLVNVTPEVVNKSVLHCLSHEVHARNWLALIVLIIEIIVGLPGSVGALWIFCFRMKVWKPHNLFLFNLVLADFLLLVSVPFRLDIHLRADNWVFGQVWCSINLFMLSANRSASIAFMTVVALDRYFKVVHPHHGISRMTSVQATWLTVLMWTAVIALRIPLLTTDLLHHHGNVTLCRSFNTYSVVPVKIKVHYVAFIAEFFLPWFLLLFCSAQIACHLHQRQMDRHERVQRAIRAVVVISAVFTFCFMPSVVTGLVGIHIKTFYPTDCPLYYQFTQLFKMCISLTYLNSALDPLIYCLSSSMFRGALKSAVNFKKNVRLANSVPHNS